MKKIRKFFKSKKGNLIIIAMIIIPVMFSAIASSVSVQRRVNTAKSEIIISLDSYGDYVNKTYGKSIKTQDGDACRFTNTGKEETKRMFGSYFSNIDGYVESLWSYELDFVIDEKDNQEYLTIVCHAFLPKLDSKLISIDYWGTHKGGVTYGDGGWYKTQERSFNLLLENKPTKKEDNSYWIYKKIEIKTSCY